MHSQTRHAWRRCILGLGGISLLAVFLLVTVGRTSAIQGFADPVQPPSPPPFVPTPIGPPPGPPTLTPTVTPTPVATATPIVAVTSTATVTATPATRLQFSLDAARVSRVNNPGNLRGLVTVRPGSRTWLMMYFTVTSVPRSMTRITTYTIQAQGKTLYKVAYSGKVTSADTGRYSRYTVYQVPRTLPYGSYVYRAILAIGKRHETKSWPFKIATQTRESSASEGKS